MRQTLLLLLACASLSGCAPERLLSASELQPDPPRRLALAIAEPRRRVEIDGVWLGVHDSDPSGVKPAIVCLHAIGHGGGDFAAFETAFAERFRVISIDWPGHGISGPDTQPASADRYASLLLGLLDALALERPVLFGNSIGGAAAIRVAQQHPDRVRALILANPGGLDPGDFIARLFIGHLLSWFRRGAAGEVRFHAWFRNYYAGILLGSEAAARRDAIVAAGYESAPRLVEAWSSFSQPQADLRPGLRDLRMPVFIGWAMRDGLVQWGRNRAAIALIPGATVVRFSKSGHSPFMEESASFNAAVAPFLDRLR